MAGVVVVGACAVSAGVHGALVSEHLQEAPAPGIYGAGVRQCDAIAQPILTMADMLSSGIAQQIQTASSDRAAQGPPTNTSVAGAAYSLSATGASNLSGLEAPVAFEIGLVPVINRALRPRVTKLTAQRGRTSTRFWKPMR